jgi:carbamoyltransferase
MLESPVVRVERRSLIPAVTHVDQTARVQTVRADQNPPLYLLLQEFQKLTGIPLLLNTSLNVNSKPIANDTATILSMLRDTDLDYAVIDDRLFWREGPPGSNGAVRGD